MLTPGAAVFLAIRKALKTNGIKMRHIHRAVKVRAYSPAFMRT